MKKNCQKPTTNVVLVQPAQLITDSGDQVKTVNSGLEGGTEQIRAFAELGFGEQGILLAGL